MLPIPHSRPWLDGRDRSALLAAFDSGMLNQGSGVEALVGAFSDAFQAEEAVALASGTQALVLALMALGLGSGDEVIVPDYVCYDLAIAVEHVGARPVIADVGPDYLLTPETAAPVVSSRSRAIILPYLFGFVPDAAAFRRFGLPIVEDLAHITDPGAIADVMLGDAAIFSFDATKTLCGGEGGLVLTRRSEVAAKLRKARIWGAPDRINKLCVLSDLQAVLVRSQFARVAEITARRRAFADRYAEVFGTLPGVALPHYDGARSVPFRFPLRLAPSRSVDDVISNLSRHGVTARRPVSILIGESVGAPAATPSAHALLATTVSLPFYPALDETAVAHVLSAARTVLGASARVS
jgi:dTDP-4-amino-4,6-dideoxygalactose transaminase